jgi:hypothetical protein
LRLARLPRLIQALALAQAAAQQAPDAADVSFVLGQTLLASGRIPEGRQAMATALRLARANHPDYQTYLINQLEHPWDHRQPLNSGLAATSRQPRNIFPKSGMFFASKQHQLFDRNYHASHHDFTFPKPHQKTPVKPENRLDGRL